MLFVTLGGIFIVSALIGVITNGIEDKLDELRKGRSFVVEKRPHADPRLVAQDLHHPLRAGARQREPRRSRAIVILAEQDKVEMEDEIATRWPTPARPASSAAPAARST